MFTLRFHAPARIRREIREVREILQPSCYARRIAEDTSLYVRWAADCHHAAGDDAARDWSVFSAFAGSQIDAATARRNKRSLIHREKP